MNLKRSIAGAAVVLLLLPLNAQAQIGGGYDLSWNVVAGGATASGGNYTLSATAGQAGAAQSANGSLLLLGGFWHWPDYKISLPICVRDR